MKHFYLLIPLFFLLNLQPIKAVLPDGSVATDWTLTDLNGNTHNLYSILNSGKHVVLDFSATWCGPCWNYHNQHILTDLWNLYGPNGTDEIMVFFIEADVNTSLECLYGPAGCSGGTQGNWVAGTPYPIINLTSNQVRNDYQITYFPTLYAIRAQDRRVFEVGQASQVGWERWLFQSFAMDYTETVTNNTCLGNGSISLDVTEGYSTIYYQWNDFLGNSSTINNLNSGTYSCRISDTNGYFVDTEDIEVTGVPDLELTLVQQQNLLCTNDQSGSLTVGGQGGSGSYNYLWDTGDTGPTISNLSEGLYVCTITDGFGCQTQSNFGVSQPSLLGGFAYPFEVPCNGETGFVEFAGYQGTAPYMYDMGGTPQSDPYFYDLLPGTYTYNVTDANGCEFQSNFELTQIPSPIAIASATGSLDCTVLQTSVTGAGSSSGNQFTYTWTTLDGNIVSGGNSLIAVVDAPGVYTLAVYNTSEDCTSYAEATVVSTASLPEATIAPADALTCTFTERTLDGTGSSTGDNYTYLWSTTDGNIVSGGTTLFPVIDAPGEYSLQVTNTENGCLISTETIVVQDVSVPSLVLTDAEITCENSSVEICGTAPEGLTIQWNVGGELFEGNCVTVSEIGEYTASVVGNNGCSNSQIATVTASADLPQVELEAADLITCVLEQITLTGVLEGNPDDFTITWTTINGNIIEGENSLTPVVDKEGIYTLTVSNPANGCTTVSSIEVDEDKALPIAQYSSTQNGDDLVLTAEITGTINSLLWDLGNGETSTEESVTISFENTGNYTICLTTTNDCGETTTCNEIFYISSIKTQAQVASLKCFGENDGRISVTPSGGLPEFTISWTGPNGFTSSEFELTGLEAGTYIGVLTDAQGTEVTLTYEIKTPSQISETSVVISNDVNSGNIGSIDLAIEGGTGDLTYLWSNGSTDASLTNISAGEYTVIVTDANGCSKEFGPYIVENSSNTNETTWLNDFKLSPNPASDKVNLKVNFKQNINKAEVRIYDSVGKLVSSQSFDHDIDTSIDVSIFNQGLYYLELSTQNAVFNKKFIVVR